ncbi:MAG: hypothetical protein AB7H93_08370 [Vicinamibacterales bacterium]
MDDVQNRFARELADAIATAVAQSAEVESCRERARAAGFDLRVTLEATVGFASRGGADGAEPAAAPVATAPRHQEITANDRRFLRSLRIAADEVKVEEAN